MARSVIYPEGLLPAGMAGMRRYVVAVDPDFTGTVEIEFRKGELHKATEKEEIIVLKPSKKRG